MTTHTLSITIGRNAPHDDTVAPMSRRDWARFQDDTIYAVRTAAYLDREPDTIHYGQGIWEGIPEESAILSWFNVPEPTAMEAGRLTAWLEQTARAFQQDSIAIQWSVPVFAEGK